MTLIREKDSKKSSKKNEKNENEVYDYWQRCKNLPGYDFLKSENYSKKEVKEEESKF